MDLKQLDTTLKRKSKTKIATFYSTFDIINKRFFKGFYHYNSNYCITWADILNLRQQTDEIKMFDQFGNNFRPLIIKLNTEFEQSS